MKRFLNSNPFDFSSSASSSIPPSPFKKVLIGYDLVAEVAYLTFIEQVVMHVDAGWIPAGNVQILDHHCWEELQPKTEKRFCLQMVLYEAVELSSKPDKPMQRSLSFV